MRSKQFKTLLITNQKIINLTLCIMFSEWVRRVGNLPALERPGPSNLGICLMSDSDAMNASYDLASFLTSFLSLFSFFRSSTAMNGMSFALASSQCCASPNMHTLYEFLGTWGSLLIGNEIFNISK